MYIDKVKFTSDVMFTVKNNELLDPIGEAMKSFSGRTILKGGFVVDPKNNIETVKDIAIIDGVITEVADSIPVDKDDRSVNCDGFLVVPGLIDVHIHLGDLFEISTDPIGCAARAGVTMGLSPGAGNTYMAPALLAAEVDRGLPINLGVYLGAANVMGTHCTKEELIKYFRGELPEEDVFSKITRTAITGSTGNIVVGIKEHMGHFLITDQQVDDIYDICTEANMVFLSHTQDPEHCERIVGLSKGRAVHLGHASAGGCGTDEAYCKESMERIVAQVKNNNECTAEFVSSNMRPSRGHRECLVMGKSAQQIAFDALADKTVDIIISDGHGDATMKGYGDSRDNVPAILELAEQGVLSLKDSVATMTSNPAAHLAKRTANPWFEKVGNLGVGSMGNVTVISRENKLPMYVFVNGEMVSFENRSLRCGNRAGGWISRFGMTRRPGIGDLPMYKYGK